MGYEVAIVGKHYVDITTKFGGMWITSLAVLMVRTDRGVVNRLGLEHCRHRPRSLAMTSLEAAERRVSLAQRLL